MDESVGQRAGWAPRAGLVAGGWALAIVAAVWAAFPSSAVDAPSRLIAATAAIGLAVAALAGTLARPRLRADAVGITVRGLTGAHSYPWPSIEQAHVVRTRRWGRETALLEIDVAESGTERLLVFGKLDLGADPDDVAEELARIRRGRVR